MKIYAWVAAGAAAVTVAVALNAPGAASVAGWPLITSISRSADGRVTVRWAAETNTFNNLVFTVQTTPSLKSNFTSLLPAVPESASLVYTDAVVSGANSGFYRVAATTAFTPLNQPGAFSAFAATNVNGLHTVGYAGAVFDGRYVYFVPYQDGTNTHGRVLRYDTQAGFTNATSWSAYDAFHTGAGGAAGYTGGAFDGRYVYFSPQNNNGASHGRVLRYDTQAGFTNAGSWALYDAGGTDGYLTTGFQGTVFDGRFLYFAPHYNTNWNGIVVRYDTTASFTNASSWHAYDASNTSGLPTRGYSSAVFDGRYVYFVPVFNGAGNGCVLRYDPQLPFTNGASWAAYDASHTGGLNSVAFKGAVFDGRYIFFVPYLNNGVCVVLRYDTQVAFTNAQSWTAYDATVTDGLVTEGYDGAVFDGRFLFFTPYASSTNSVFHGRVLSYDTQAPFTNSASWHAFDAGATSGLQTQGYVGAVSDGRYIYFAPYRNIPENFQGNVLRFDARLPRLIPATVTGGSNL